MERSDQGRRRARRGAMLQYLGDKIWRQAARREAGPRREAWADRPACRPGERRGPGEGTEHAGDVMNMSPERRFVGVRGRRRRPRVRLERRIADRRVRSATLRPPSPPRPRGARRSARAERCKTATWRDGGLTLEFATRPVYLLTILDVEAQSLLFRATIPSPRRLSNDKISVKRHLCHTGGQCV